MGTHTRSSESAGREPDAEASGPVAMALVDERAHLDQHIARLRVFCAALRHDRVTADPIALIEELECELVSYLAIEDLEVFWGSLVTDDPPLRARVERLQAEHDDLAEALDHLMELAGWKPPSPPALAEEFERFLDALQAHERAETAFMQELVEIDETERRLTPG